MNERKERLHYETRCLEALKKGYITNQEYGAMLSQGLSPPSPPVDNPIPPRTTELNNKITLYDLILPALMVVVGVLVAVKSC